MTATTSADQQEIADRLVFTAGRCLAPFPPDLDDSLIERLDTFVFALFPELEGAGGMPQMSLTPKGHPDVDLVDHHLHDTWPDVEEADNPHVQAFLLSVRYALNTVKDLATTLVDADDPDGRSEMMRRLGVAVCRVIEDRYELRVVEFDEDDGEFAGVGENIAPGLTDAFAAAWADAAR